MEKTMMLPTMLCQMFEFEITANSVSNTQVANVTEFKVNLHLNLIWSGIKLEFIY